jgi:HSP20 family protein
MAMERMRRPRGGGDLAREMVPLRVLMDRLLENAFTPLAWGEGRTGLGGPVGAFSMDVYEDDNAYYVDCLLPGIDPNAVNVSVQDNNLTISGETKRTIPEGRRPLLQEIGAGQFQRQVTLATPVEAGQAEATYRDGILESKLPKAETSRPRTIQVRTGGAGR